MITIKSRSIQVLAGKLATYKHYSSVQFKRVDGVWIATINFERA